MTLKHFLYLIAWFVVCVVLFLALFYYFVFSLWLFVELEIGRRSGDIGYVMITTVPLIIGMS